MTLMSMPTENFATVTHKAVTQHVLDLIGTDVGNVSQPILPCRARVWIH